MLQIQHLTKAYGDKKAVDDLSLHIAAGRNLRLHRPQRRGQDHHAEIRGGHSGL